LYKQGGRGGGKGGGGGEGRNGKFLLHHFDGHILGDAIWWRHHNYVIFDILEVLLHYY